MPRTDAVSRTERKPRFAISHQFTTIFADRLRLNAFDDLEHFFIGIQAEDPEAVDKHQALVTINLAKKDRAAYKQAAAAFNAILDEHEQRGRLPRPQLVTTAVVMLAALSAWPLVMARCVGLA